MKISMTNSLNILRVGDDSVLAAYELIKNLAEHEGYIDDFSLTEKQLKFALANTACSEAYIAYVNRQASGLLFLSKVFSTFWGTDTFYIQDLYVRSDFRGLGIGKKLIEHTFEVAKNRGYKRVFWEVQKSNEKAKTLYQSIGAKLIEYDLFRYEKL